MSAVSEEDEGRKEKMLRKELTELIGSATARSSEVYAAMSRNFGIRSLLYLHRDKARGAVKDFCHKIQLQVSELQKSLLDEVAALTQEKEEALTRERESLSYIKEQFINCQDCISVLLQVGHEELLAKKGAEFADEVRQLLQLNLQEANDDVQHLKFHPTLNLEEWHLPETIGYLQSTSIDLADVRVVSAGNFHKAYVGVTEILTLRVAPGHIPEGAKVIEVDIADPEGRLVDWEVSDNEDGSYNVTYTPEVQGLHTLAVKVYKCHIIGSPFAVAVLDKLDVVSSSSEDSLTKVQLPRRKLCSNAISAVNKFLVSKNSIEKQLHGDSSLASKTMRIRLEMLRNEKDMGPKPDLPRAEGNIQTYVRKKMESLQEMNSTERMTDMTSKLSFDKLATSKVTPQATDQQTEQKQSTQSTVNGEGEGGNSRWSRPVGWLGGRKPQAASIPEGSDNTAATKTGSQGNGNSYQKVRPGGSDSQNWRFRERDVISETIKDRTGVNSETMRDRIVISKPNLGATRPQLTSQNQDSLKSGVSRSLITPQTQDHLKSGAENISVGQVNGKTITDLPRSQITPQTQDRLKSGAEKKYMGQVNGKTLTDLPVSTLNSGGVATVVPLKVEPVSPELPQVTNAGDADKKLTLQVNNKNQDSFNSEPKTHTSTWPKPDEPLPDTEPKPVEATEIKAEPITPDPETPTKLDLPFRIGASPSRRGRGKRNAPISPGVPKPHGLFNTININSPVKKFSEDNSISVVTDKNAIPVVNEKNNVSIVNNETVHFTDSGQTLALNIPADAVNSASDTNNATVVSITQPVATTMANTSTEKNTAAVVKKENTIIQPVATTIPKTSTEKNTAAVVKKENTIIQPVATTMANTSTEKNTAAVVKKENTIIQPVATTIANTSTEKNTAAVIKKENTIATTIANTSTEKNTASVVKKENTETKQHKSETTIPAENNESLLKTVLKPEPSKTSAQPAIPKPLPAMPADIDYSCVTISYEKSIRTDCLKFPIGVHANNELIAIANNGQDTVLILGPAGQIRCTLGGGGTFKHPSAVLLKDDKVFVKDDKNIHIYDTKGNYHYACTKSLKHPYGLAMTEEGTLLVLDHFLNTVFEFRTDGSLATSWPFEPLVNKPRYAKCRFLDVYHDTLVVTDLGLNAIHFVDMKSHKVKKTIAHERTNAPGLFNEPSGVTFDRLGNVLIADSRNNRIQVLSQAGDFKAVLPLPKGKLFRPSDIHLTEQGLLYVSNLLGHNVGVFKIH